MAKTNFSDRQVMLQREIKRLEQLMIADLEITANQRKYDVKVVINDLFGREVRTLINLKF